MKISFFLLLFLVALSHPLLAQEETKISTFKIGVCLPLSGKYKNLGKNTLQAIELAAAENEITLAVKNCKEVGPSIQALASDPKVVAILGPIGAKRSREAIRVADEVGIPIFTFSSALADHRNSKWAYRFRLAPEEQGEIMGTLASKDLGQKKAAVLWPDTEFGRRATLAFIKAFEEGGGVVSAESGYSPETTDFTDTLKGLLGIRFYVGDLKALKKNRRGYARVKQRRARVDFDALFIPDFHHRVSRLLAFLPLIKIQNGTHQEGKYVQLLGLSSWQGSSMKFSQGVASGALYPDLFAGDAGGGPAEEFVRMFESEYDRAPVDLEADAYDLTWLLSSIIVRMNPKNITPRTRLISKLPYKKEWVGISGPVRFRANGDPLRFPDIYRFDSNGEVTPAY